MTIQDSDPERRNLMVTSLAFITYFFGGGHLVDEVVRLQVVNVKFEHPVVLAVIAWSMLFWFTYRYWQKHSGKFRSGFQTELGSFINKPYILNHLIPILNEQSLNPGHGGYGIHSVSYRNYALHVEWFYNRDGANSTASYNAARSNDKTHGRETLKGFYGLVVTFHILVECFLTNRSRWLGLISDSGKRVCESQKKKGKTPLGSDRVGCGEARTASIMSFNIIALTHPVFPITTLTHSPFT